jgi:glycosyltransferase involved in cell wall biosynthesis
MWNVPEWIATRMARASGVPYLISPRGMLRPAAMARGRWRKRLAFAALERRALHGAAALHASSDQESRELRALVPDVPVVTSFNGVDTTARVIPSSRIASRRALGVPDDAFVVASVGRLHPIKRLDLVVEAVTRLRQRRPGICVVIAGPDESAMAERLRVLARDPASLRLLGPLDDRMKWQLLDSADAFVQCSDVESFGLAVAEALTAGLPAVVTRTCPWPQLETLRCGLWVEQSVDALTAALDALCADESLRRELGQRAARYAAEHFGWDAIARAMAGHYRDAIRGGAARHIA